MRHMYSNISTTGRLIPFYVNGSESSDLEENFKSLFLTSPGAFYNLSMESRTTKISSTLSTDAKNIRATCTARDSHQRY